MVIVVGSFQFVQSMLCLFSAIIEFVDDRGQRPLWEGLLYAAGMFVVALFQTLLIQQYFKNVMVTGLSIRTAVLGIVYRKVNFLLQFCILFRFEIIWY